MKKHYHGIGVEKMKCNCGNQFTLVESTFDGIKKWMCEKCSNTKITNKDNKEYLTSDVPRPGRKYLVEG